MNCFYIIGLRVNHRSSNAPKLQQLLTQFGCNIKMRVGLHEVNPDYCSDDGVIMLQVCGDKEILDSMLRSFNDLDGVTPKMMDLN